MLLNADGVGAAAYKGGAAAGAGADDDADEWVEVPGSTEIAVTDAAPPHAAGEQPAQPATKRRRTRKREPAHDRAVAINALGAAALANAHPDAAPAAAAAAAAAARPIVPADTDVPLPHAPGVSLPPELLALASAYDALAAVSAFFRAREHMVCTFEKIRKPVQDILGRYAPMNGPAACTASIGAAPGRLTVRARFPCSLLPVLLALSCPSACLFLPVRLPSLTRPPALSRSAPRLCSRPRCREVSLETVARLRVVAPTHVHVAWVDVAPTIATPFMVQDGQSIAPPPASVQLQLRFGHEPQHRRPAGTNTTTGGSGYVRRAPTHPMLHTPPTRPTHLPCPPSCPRSLLVPRRDVLGGGLPEVTNYAGMHRRVGRVAAAAQKSRSKLLEDMTVWYSHYLADGGTPATLEAHLAARAATALPPLPSGDDALGAAKGFTTELGLVHAPVRPVTYTGSVEAVLESLRAQPTYRAQIVHTHVLQGQEADYGTGVETESASATRIERTLTLGPFQLCLNPALLSSFHPLASAEGWPVWLPLCVREALRDAYGIKRLYAHQTEAIKALHDTNDHVVIATATSRSVSSGPGGRPVHGTPSALPRSPPGIPLFLFRVASYKQRQVAGVQSADGDGAARVARPRTCPLPLPDQGAGPGPVPRPAHTRALPRGPGVHPRLDL